VESNQHPLCGNTCSVIRSGRNRESIIIRPTHLTMCMTILQIIGEMKTIQPAYNPFANQSCSFFTQNVIINSNL